MNGIEMFTGSSDCSLVEYCLLYEEWKGVFVEYCGGTRRVSFWF